MESNIPSSVREIAEADFTHIADSFDNAGFAVRLPARGILQLTSPNSFLRRPRLLLSAGIHGDETAPIEILAQLLTELAGTPQALAVDLMVIVGNPAAIAQGKRFVDVDLNRLFCADRNEFSSTVEGERADVIMRASARFFDRVGMNKWHLDLHSAIRPSHYPSFAVVPELADSRRRPMLLGALGKAGIGAVILNKKPAPTFSAYTAGIFGAASATVELGQIGALGNNDLSRFDAARTALDGFLRSGRTLGEGSMPHLFQVRQELIKHSDAFRMSFDKETWNFTAIQPGSVIAEDGPSIYRVGNVTEYLVFPNPDVRIGLRAGLMVVREELHAEM